MKRVYIKKNLLFVPILLSFIATLLMPAWIVYAANASQFSLSTNSGRPGLRVEINQVDSCPARPAAADYQYVEFAFVDSAGTRTVSTYQASTDANGNWQNSTLIVVPWRDVVGGRTPIETIPQAAAGQGSIQAQCIAGTSAGDPMDPNDDIKQTTQTYTPQPFYVTGPSLEFTVSASTVTTGSMVHLSSVDPCPGSEIHGSIINNQAVSNFYLPLDTSGTWSVDVPAASTDMMGQLTNFPAGQYEINAFCMTPNGLSTVFYGEQLINVTGATPSNYVALGDSYSSGEGLEPFEAGTFEAGGNMCHRSSQAYPRLLANDTSLPLDLGSNGFAACSGATTAAITLGNNNEGAQMDKITADTKLITMTVGGNNMGFAQYAEACIKKDCTGKPSTDAILKIVRNVIPQMEYTLGTIRDRLINLHNSNATVLILGYPQIVPAHPYSNTSATGCEWLGGDREAAAIRNVVTLLNTAIKNEVNAVGYNFHFLSATDANSPFTNHELCRDSFVYGTPYFFNVVPFPTEKQRYTFHPNAQGQQAYATLVKNYLTQHPL